MSTNKQLSLSPPICLLFSLSDAGTRVSGQVRGGIRIIRELAFEVRMRSAGTRVSGQRRRQRRRQHAIPAGGARSSM